MAGSNDFLESRQMVPARFKQLGGRQRKFGPLGRGLQIGPGLLQQPRRRFVSDRGQELTFLHAFADRSTPSRESVRQPNEAGILRANMDDKRRLNADGSINRSDGGAATNRCYLRYRKQKIIRDEKEENEHGPAAPQNFLGFRQFQLLELMQVSRGVLGKLKVTARGPFPFGHGEIVLIIRFE